jgi:undecaprenyl-diphosphatase
MVDTLASIDLALLRWVTSALRAAWLNPWMTAIGPASVYGLPFLVLGVLVTAWRRDGRALMALWRVVLAVWLASVVTTSLLKPAIARDRPFVADASITVVGRPATGTSMPSGHATTAVAGAFTLSLLWPGGRALAWVLAALVLFSRVYLGQHYPGDVVVGGLVGWACAWFATAATRASPGRYTKSDRDAFLSQDQ